MQRELGITQDCNVENVIFASYGHKKQRKYATEREKQQHVIATENNLLKGFTTEGVQNYDQKQSGKFDNGVTWNSLRCERFLWKILNTIFNLI